MGVLVPRAFDVFLLGGGAIAIFLSEASPSIPSARRSSAHAMNMDAVVAAKPARKRQIGGEGCCVAEGEAKGRGKRSRALAATGRSKQRAKPAESS